MSSETTVGSIIGFLRLDASQWNDELDKAEAKADALGHHDPKIKIELNAAEIIAKLDAVTAAVSAMDKNQSRLTLNGNQSLKNLEKAYASTGTTAKQSLDRAAESTRKVTTETEKLDKANKDAKQSGSAMLTAIIALGPALVPIAGGAAALAAGFGGMGAAGILAIAGIKDQMAKGTAEGLTYKSTLDSAKASIMTLATTAAGNVLGPLQQAVADLHSRMPSLNSEIGLLATATGKVGASVVNGLLSAFVQLEPVMSAVAVYAVNLAARFDAMMSGPGVKSFGDYALSVFPQVMATLESLVEAAVHLAASFAPLGGGVLTEVKALADAINWFAGFAPGALTAIASGVGAVALGFKAWQGLSGLASGFGSALEKVGFSAETAAGGIRAMEAATGVVGVAIAGLSIVMELVSNSTRNTQQATDDYTQALIASNGALDENVRKTALKHAQDDGTIKDANELGVSLNTLVDAYLGNSNAIDTVNSAYHAQHDALTGQKGTLADTADKVDHLDSVYGHLTSSIGDSKSQVDAAKVAFQQQQDVLAKTGGVTSQAALDAYDLAQKYGTTTTAAEAVAGAQQKSADQAAQATLKMQLENNAAGLLKQSLDALSGKSLSAAQAQNSFDSALTNMGDHVTATGSKIHFTTTSINDMSAASVSLRGQLLGQVTSAQQTAEAYGQMAGSSEVGRQKLITLRQQIIDNAVAHGVDRKAVTDYIDSVLKVPKSVPPTKLDADTKAATAKVDSFGHDVDYQTRPRTVDVGISVSGVGAAMAAISPVAALANVALTASQIVSSKGKATGGQIEGRASGGPVPGFAGGTLIGPGTGTSDSILSMVAETGKLLRVSAGEFISTDASRQRNLAALEAGNRGAVLQVAGQGASGRTVHQTFQIQPTDPYAVARETARYYDMLGA